VAINSWITRFLESLKNYSVYFDDPGIRGIEEKLRTEREEDSTRESRFSKDFKRISAIPSIGFIARSCYAVGFSQIVLLILILGLFTAIKAPYFGLPFTGEHAIKYSAYVEPAYHMVQKNDVTWYQLKYRSDPVKNPNGVFKRFEHLPLFEWGLYVMYKYLPYGSIETKTRIYTHLIGLMTLIFGYLFFRGWVPSNFSLMIVLFMAINPIITFSTFVTVIDSLAILLMFLSFILLNKYYYFKKTTRLCWAGVVFGIGLATKYSMFLWVAPISIMLIYYRSQGKVNFLQDCAVYLGFGFLFVLSVHTSILNLPTKSFSSVLLMLIWLGVFIILFVVISKYQATIHCVAEVLCTSKIFISVTAVIISVTMVYFWKYMNFSDFAADFLTDQNLLFNRKLYQYMLRIQFKEYMTPNVFWLAIIGIIMILTTKENDLKKLTISLLFGSIIYWIIASKAMFFHNYYTIIIMMLFCLSASFVVYYLLININSVKGKVFIMLLFLLIIFPRAFEASISRLNTYNDISGIKEYILRNTNEGDIIINETDLSTLSIYTDRSLIYMEKLVNNPFRNEIRQNGFSETMRIHQVKYVMTDKDNPSYIDFAPLFAETKIREPRWDRKMNILNAIDKKQGSLQKDFKELEKIVLEYKIYDKFHFEAKIGKFNFFTFVN